MRAVDDNALGRLAYEEFQRQVGHDPARLPWEKLERDRVTGECPIQQKWIAIARAVATSATRGR